MDAKNKEKIVKFEEYRRDPAREYQRKIQKYSKYCSQGEAWKSMSDDLEALSDHFELGGNVLDGIDYIAVLRGCCLENVRLFSLT